MVVLCNNTATTLNHLQGMAHHHIRTDLNKYLLLLDHTTTKINKPHRVVVYPYLQDLIRIFNINNLISLRFRQGRPYHSLQAASTVALQALCSLTAVVTPKLNSNSAAGLGIIPRTTTFRSALLQVDSCTIKPSTTNAPQPHNPAKLNSPGLNLSTMRPRLHRAPAQDPPTCAPPPAPAHHAMPRTRARLWKTTGKLYSRLQLTRSRWGISSRITATLLCPSNPSRRVRTSVKVSTAGLVRRLFRHWGRPICCSSTIARRMIRGVVTAPRIMRKGMRSRNSRRRARSITRSRRRRRKVKSITRSSRSRWKTPQRYITRRTTNLSQRALTRVSSPILLCRRRSTSSLRFPPRRHRRRVYRASLPSSAINMIWRSWRPWLRSRRASTVSRRGCEG
jgi:hypothetical protein